MLHHVCHLGAAGRKEAEMVKSGAVPSRPSGQGSRRSPDGLEPVSVSNRRSVAVVRGAQHVSTPVHAPKFSTQDALGAKPGSPARCAPTRHMILSESQWHKHQ